MLSSILQRKASNATGSGMYPVLPVGIDDVSQIPGQVIFVRLCFYFLVFLTMTRWFSTGRIEGRQQTSSDDHPSIPRILASELGEGEIQEGTCHECAICLENMPAGTNVRILPCRHVFHHECIDGWMREEKFSCPLCKFDLAVHFEEQRAAASSIQNYRRNHWRTRFFGRIWFRRINDADDKR